MKHEIQKELGIRIARLRNQKGWNQDDLAEFAGISTNTVSNIERANRDVGIRTIMSVAKALDIPVSQLFYDTENIPVGKDPLYLDFITEIENESQDSLEFMRAALKAYKKGLKKYTELHFNGKNQ